MPQHTSQANTLNKKSGSQWPDLTFDAVDRILTLSGGWTGNQRNGHYSTKHHLSRVLIKLYRSAPNDRANDEANPSDSMRINRAPA